MACSLKSLYKSAPETDNHPDEGSHVHRLIPEYSPEEQEDFEVTGRVETK